MLRNWYELIWKRDIVFKKVPKKFLETKTIFTHIPKAAGISIADSLYGQEVGHIPLKNYKQILGETLFDEYFKFTFVRHPIKRFESAYYFLKLGGLNKYDSFYSNKILNQYKDINDFIINYINEKTIYDYLHFIPQFYFLEGQGKLLCDYIGKVENIDQDKKYIEEAVGMHLNINKQNITKKKDQTILTEKSVKILRRVYNKDFEYFKY